MTRQWNLDCKDAKLPLRDLPFIFHSFQTPKPNLCFHQKKNPPEPTFLSYHQTDQVVRTDRDLFSPKIFLNLFVMKNNARRCTHHQPHPSPQKHTHHSVLSYQLWHGKSVGKLLHYSACMHHSAQGCDTAKAQHWCKWADGALRRAVVTSQFEFCAGLHKPPNIDWVLVQGSTWDHCINYMSVTWSNCMTWPRENYITRSIMLNISVDGSEQLLRSQETRGLHERGRGGVLAVK